MVEFDQVDLVVPFEINKIREFKPIRLAVLSSLNLINHVY